MKKIINIATFYLIPFVVLLLAYTLFLKIEMLSASWVLLLQYSSYILFFTGMLLGYGFNRSKIFFMGFMLAITQVGLMYWEIGKVYPIIMVLIPLNILIFSCFKERGVLSLWGKARIAFILLQILAVFMVIHFDRKDVIELFNTHIIHSNFINFNSLPQIAVFTFAFALFTMIIKSVIIGSVLDSTSVGVLIAVAISFYLRNNAMAIPIFFTAGGLMLVLAVIQVSYAMAYIDELTGIPSRRALREEMMKLGGKYTIAMMDIDFFKKFNDKYGHDVGDDVLKLVASCIENVSGGGKFFRYGGEEFTVLFPNKTLKEVVPHLEKLRVNISKRGYTYRKGKSTKQLFVTMSIGIAEKNERYRTADEVIKAADKALYRAKKKGRNCVSK